MRSARWAARSRSWCAGSCWSAAGRRSCSRTPTQCGCATRSRTWRCTPRRTSTSRRTACPTRSGQTRFPHCNLACAMVARPCQQLRNDRGTKHLHSDQHAARVLFRFSQLEFAMASRARIWSCISSQLSQPDARTHIVPLFISACHPRSRRLPMSQRPGHTSNSAAGIRLPLGSGAPSTQVRLAARCARLL